LFAKEGVVDIATEDEDAVFDVTGKNIKVGDGSFSDGLGFEKVKPIDEVGKVEGHGDNKNPGGGKEGDETGFPAGDEEDEAKGKEGKDGEGVGGFRFLDEGVLVDLGEAGAGVDVVLGLGEIV
jgi:hypothetical protein